MGTPIIGPGKLRVWTELSFAEDSTKSARAELTRVLSPCTHVEMVGRVGYELRRAERYLALFAGYRIPSAYETAGPSVPMISAAQRQVFLTSARRWELPHELDGIYSSADTLLNAFPDDSYIGKAVENIGATDLTDDLDSWFVYAWNGVELLAKEYRYERDQSLPRIASDGQRHDPLRVSSIVEPLIRDFHDGATPPNLDWLAYLRNGSAHGGLSNYPGNSAAEDLERWDKAEAIRDLAFEVLINYLSKRGTIPPVARPVHRRVLVPSFRKDWKVEPIDESTKLAKQGMT